MARDTRTGGVLESMVFPALVRGGYRGTKQVNIGLAPGDRKHRVDVLVDTDDGDAFRFVLLGELRHTLVVSVRYRTLNRDEQEHRAVLSGK